MGGLQAEISDADTEIRDQSHADPRGGPACRGLRDAGPATPAEIEAVTAGVDLFLSQVGASCLDLTDRIGTGALLAARTYRRCVGHPAALNLGDCCAYACAKELRVGLIYKGEDFARTDMA
jgi:ribonuclease VapC